MHRQRQPAQGKGTGPGGQIPSPIHPVSTPPRQVARRVCPSRTRAFPALFLSRKTFQAQRRWRKTSEPEDPHWARSGLCAGCVRDPGQGPQPPGPLACLWRVDCSIHSAGLFGRIEGPYKEDSSLPWKITDSK